MEDLNRIKELKQQGFYCSQIILVMGMELLGKENPDLVRCMSSLAGGIGWSGEVCGALTGGACLVGLYAGKGTPQDAEDLRQNFMLMDLVKWFKEEHGERYGGIRCEQILAGDQQNKAVRCPVLVSTTFQKVKELLVENGFDLSGLDQ
jgi:C_GCAxxG_C_C family probable redox protein